MMSSTRHPYPIPPGAAQTFLQASRVLTYLRISREGTILAANPTRARRFELAEGEVTGASVLGLLTEDDQNRMRGWLAVSNRLGRDGVRRAKLALYAQHRPAHDFVSLTPPPEPSPGKRR